MEDPPIQSPKNEQAHHAIAGYLYQSWLAVEEWLTLGKDEVLYVECAEDFAKFSADDTARITQVKHTSATITLRNSNVIDALNHYWAFKNKNGKLRIKYCYVTTSRIGQEHGDHFEGIDGLKLWKQTARDRDITNARALKNFLVTDNSVKKQLSPSLLGFLEACSDQEFIELFVCSVHWDDCHHETEDARSAAEQLLAVYAEKAFNTVRAHAKNFATALLTHVIELSAQEEKVPLTSALRDAIIAKCYEATSISKSNAIRNSDISAIFSGVINTVPDNEYISELVTPWELNDDYSLRTDAIAEINENYPNSRFLLISGSSGMGKSTLAQIKSKSIRVNWLTLSVRHADMLRTARGLQECIWIIGKHPERVGLIIDDLPWDELDAALFNILRVLARVARSKNAHIVLTNQIAPNSTQLNNAGLHDINIVPAPRMSEKEIGELCTKHGCPSGSFADAWAKILDINTSGHPQLVHASVLGLKSKDWPELSNDEYRNLIGLMNDARSESQRLLAERTEREIELLTRLCGFIGNFTREQALELASRLEPVTGASVSFNTLLGPWIEKVSNNRFKVSPLIGRSLLQECPKRRQNEIQTATSESILACQPVDGSDAADALFNALLGNAGSIVTAIVLQFIQTEHKNESGMHICLSWILHIKYENFTVFQKWPELKFMFKTLEFRVSTTLAPERSSEILNECYEYIKSPESENIRVLRKTTLAHAILVSLEAKISINHVFWAFEALKDAQTEIEQDIASGKYREFDTDAHGLPDSKWSTKNGLCVTIWPRVKTLKDLDALIEFLKNTNEDVRDKYLRQLVSMKCLALSALDQIWVGEDKRPADERNWDSTLEVFQKLRDLSLSWGCHALAACAARGISIINNEYLKDTEAAERTVIGIDTSDREVFSIISELLGKTAYDNEHYGEAFEHFENALKANPWDELGAASALNLHHHAGKASGDAKKWEESARHFRTAKELAEQDGNLIRAAAFATDSAHSEWELGNYEEALDLFAQALVYCEKFGSGDLLEIKVQKILGNNVMRLSYEKNMANRIDKEASTPISPGMCSNLETHEDIRKLPKPMLDFVWLFLLKIEFDYTDSSTYWDKKSDLFRSAHPWLRREIWSLHNRKLVRDGRFNELLRHSISEAKVSLACMKNERSDVFNDWQIRPDLEYEEQFSLADYYPMPMLLMRGITAAMLSRVDIGSILKVWKDDSKSYPQVDCLDDFIDKVALILEDTEEAAARIACEDESFWFRWAGALHILMQDTPHPQTLLIATIALTFPNYRDGGCEFIPEVVREIDPVLSSKWKRACQTRALFRNPTLFVPDIHDLACNPDGSLKHIAELALAAAPALDLKIPKSVFEDLRSVS